MLRRHVKVIVCVVAAREGIEATPVLTEELAVLILVGELFSSKEQHVFAEVSKPGQGDGVRHVPDVDVQGRCRLVRGLIRNQ